MTDEPRDPYAAPADGSPSWGGPPPGHSQPPPVWGGPPPGYPPQGYPPQGYGPGYGPAGYGQPGYGPAYFVVARTNSKAGWALGLGIAGFFLCPLTGIAAVIVGGQAKEEIRRTHEQGDGMATAGVILGWILCALMVLVVVFFIGVVLLGATADEYARYIG